MSVKKIYYLFKMHKQVIRKMKNENQIKFKSAQNKSENMCKIVNMYLKKQCRK